MHKNPHQNAGNDIKETQPHIKEHGPGSPLEVLAPSARVGQIRVRPPSPKISKPVRLWLKRCLNFDEKYFTFSIKNESIRKHN